MSIEQELREAAKPINGWATPGRADLMLRAADELSRLSEVERRAREVIRPFAEYMEDGMDLDNNGLPLPDEQGVGWIYLNHGRFRAARDLYRALSEREGQDG